MNKLIFIFLFFWLSSFSLFAQKPDSLNTVVGLRLVTGVGPMNLGKNASTGIAANNSLDFFVKNWLILSGNLHLGKSGNNPAGYTSTLFYPDFPDQFKTNFNEADSKHSKMQSFSSVGLFALLNPFSYKKSRFIFGPGICYVSWEEMTTIYSKGFRNSEYYQVSTRVTNRKKMDLGIQFNYELDLTDSVFTGLRFQGYGREESASGFSFILGIKL